MNIYKKFGHFFIIAILIVWILLTPSHFQKGGVNSDFYFIIAAFVVLISFLINLFFDNFHIIERIVISILFAFISLFIMTLKIGPFAVEKFYQDKTWFLWETKHRIFINSIYYLLNGVILSTLSIIYYKIRKEKKNLSY